MARDVDRGESDAAPALWISTVSPRLQRAHDHEQLPRSEVVHRDRRGLLVGERGRLLEDLFRRHDNDVRIAAEARQRKDILADPDWSTPLTHRVHRAGDLVADDAGSLGASG